MEESVLENIEKTIQTIDVLNIKISDQKQVAAWFKDLCNNLEKVMLCLAKYTKTYQGNKIILKKDVILLYLLQINSSLSLLIKVFLREQEVNEIISEARYCVNKQLNLTLHCLKNLLVDGTVVDNSPGSFIKWMDAALDKISDINVENGTNLAVEAYEEARPLIEEVLCHAMSIAQVAMNEDSKIIKGACETVLKTMESLSLHICKHDMNIAMCNLFVDCCNNKLCDLERKVNIAVLKLSLQVFSNIAGPLEKLQRYCFSSGEKCEETLDSLVVDFDFHVDRIMQIGLFAVACSTDKNKCVQMKSCLASLEALESELVPAFTAVSIDKSVHSENFALILIDYWMSQINKLKSLIYLIIDPSAFCQVVHDNLQVLMDDILEQKLANKISQLNFSSFIANSEVLVEMIKISLEEIPKDYLEEVKNKYKYVTDVLYEVKAAVKILLSDVETKDNTPRIIKRCKILLKVVGDLLKSLIKIDDICQENNICIQEGFSISSNIDYKNNQSVEKEDSYRINQLFEKAKQILKDRSILYKTPTKVLPNTSQIVQAPC